jgi:hypothetical protein
MVSLNCSRKKRTTHYKGTRYNLPSRLAGDGGKAGPLYNQPIEKENPGNMKNTSITMGKPLQCKFVKLTRYS